MDLSTHKVYEAIVHCDRVAAGFQEEGENVFKFCAFKVSSFEGDLRDVDVKVPVQLLFGRMREGLIAKGTLKGLAEDEMKTKFTGG